MHLEVLRRAQYLYSLPSNIAGHLSNPEDPTRELFSSFLNAPENIPVVQAGAFFPDWGYNCLWSDQDSELAHWSPFQKAWADYVAEKYGLHGQGSKTILNDDEKLHLQALVSFLMNK